MAGVSFWRSFPKATRRPIRSRGFCAPVRSERRHVFRSMDQIIKFVSERLGISESVARDAIKVLLEFARKRTAGTHLEKLLLEIPGVSALLGDPSLLGWWRAFRVWASSSVTRRKRPVCDPRACKAFSDLPFVRAFVECPRSGPDCRGVSRESSNLEVVGPEIRSRKFSSRSPPLRRWSSREKTEREIGNGCSGFPRL